MLLTTPSQPLTPEVRATPCPSEPSPDEIRAELAKILASETFSRSGRMRRFLCFTVERTLAGMGESLKEYLIGIEVYDRPETLDPRFDPIVRVEAARLRSKLREYYETEGAGDLVRIQLPKRSYVPLFERRLGVPSEDGRRPASIAVLPFADMSPRRDQEHFCDGLTEEVIHALVHVEGLRVAARTSVFEFKGQARDVRSIGRQLNVSAVLEGSVRKQGHRLRITAQLNSALDGYHLWSETYDRELKDALRLQEEISQAIVNRLTAPAAN